MMFWFVLAALTAAAIVVAFRPLLARGGTASLDRAEDHEHDIAVYRHQLQELQVEEARGALSPAEAAQARNEISRRILAVEDRMNRLQPDAAQAPGARRSGLAVLALFAVVFVPGLSFVVYTGIGSPGYRAQPLAMRLEQMRDTETVRGQTQAQLQELVARAEGHLRDNPDDGRGWDVLAPVYFRLGDAARAETAYRNAIRLLGETPQRLSGLGEALVTGAGGMVTQEATALFERSLAIDPADARGRFFAGLGEVQLGRYGEARAHWADLADDPAADPAWRMVARQNIARLDQTAPVADRLGRPPELDADTVAQMQDLAADERAAVIDDMVASLDARLREAPDDLEGWKRLIRARIVLDQDEGLRDALERAHGVYEDRPQDLASLRDFAIGLGLNVEDYWP